jgi:uncharacterized protein (UPF0332 family)
LTGPNRHKAAQSHLSKAQSALADAETLLAGGRTDAASNRAYYCCFHAARAALATLGVQPRTHRGVSERLNLDLVIPGKLEAEYLSILGRVQHHREIADYGIDAGISADDAKAGVAASRRFLDRLSEIVASAGGGP